MPRAKVKSAPPAPGGGMLSTFTVIVIVGALVFLLTRVQKMHVQLSCLRRDFLDLPPPMTEQRVSQLAARHSRDETPATTVPDEAQIREWIQAELDTSISATLATLPSAADLDGIPEHDDREAMRVGPLVRPAAEVADDDSSPPGDE